MATEVKRRRGTTVEHSTFTGAVAELTVDLTKDTVVVHDGGTQGGFPLLREDFDNVPTTAPFTNISLDTAIFDTGYSADGNEAQGTLYWNTDELTLSLVTNGETIELGQKVEVNVKNQTGSQINKGEVVYASGTVGASGRILVNKMKADGSIAAKRVLGVAAENIADGADGKVIQFGKLRKIDTSTFSDGDILWVSTSTAGAFQNTEPVQANGEIALPIAFVVYSSGASNGEIFVRVTPIDENEYQDYDAGLTDISGLTPTDSNFIVGDGTNWVAESGDTARTSLGLGTGDSPTFSGLTVNGNITVTGTVDGRDISDDGANLDELYTTIGLSSLTSNEVDQLENIGEATTINATQWGYLGDLDQPLTTGDTPTFNRVVLTNQADDGTKAVRADRNISAGDGITGGGDLTGDRTITLGTPSTTTVGGSNAVTANSHTHALDLSGRSITLSDDSDGVITFDSNTQDLGADRTYTPTIADHASGQRGVLNDGTSAQTIYGDKTFDADVFLNTKIESSSGYTSGITGAGTIYTTDQQEDDSNVSFFEVDNMRVRNELRAHIFKKDIVKASNAYLFITDAAEIAEFSEIQNTTDTFKVILGDDNATFEHGDLLWAKNIKDDASLQVTGVKIEVSVQPQFVWDTSEEVWNTSEITPDDYVEFVTGTVDEGIHVGKTFREYNIYEVTDGGELNAGDTIVRVSDGSILNDASSQYSPFIDIYDGVETWADFQNVDKTKVRLGNLEGVSNASGYGLYTQNAFLTGALLVGDLTKAGNYLEYSGGNLSGVFNDIDFDSNTFSLETTNLRIDSQDEIIQIGSGDWVELGNLGSSEYGLSLNSNNYWKYNTLASTYFFKVGSATNFISFNTATNVLDIETNEFSLTAGSMTIDSSDGITIGLNDFFKQDKTFSFGGGILSGTSNTVSISGSGASIDVDTFNLESTTIQLGDSISLTQSDITTTYDYGASTLVFSGIFNNTYNYFGYLNDIDDVHPDGYVFRVGDNTNFMELNTSNNIAKIVFDTFDLNATSLVIDSATNSGKIALGATPPTAYNSGTGIYFDGTGKALIGNATGNKIQFDGTDLDLQTDTFDLATNTLVIDSDNNKIALGTSPDSITIAGTEAGFIANGSGEFKGYIDASNYIRLDSSGLDIKAEEFDLTANDLLINSGTSTQTAYTPSTDTTLISNGAFTSTVTFNDNDLDGTSGTFATIDETVGWEADRLGTSTFVYDGTNDYVLFRIAKTASTNRVRLWQDQETLTNYTGKTLTFTVTVGRPSSNGWYEGDLYLKVYGEINSTLTEVATTIVSPDDITIGTADDFDVTAYIRDDYNSIRVAIEYPEQDATTGAPISYHEIQIRNVATYIYDATQVTLNNNGLSVYKSPIQEFTLTADDFALNGIGIKTDDISIPNLIELNRSTSTMRVPDEGYANFAYTEISGTSRLYVRLSDGTLKYVNLT